MQNKKKIGAAIMQLCLIAVFTLLAVASGTDGASTSSSYSSGSSDWSSVARAAAQGGVCGGSGYKFIGYYSTNSECESACAQKGYSAFCTGNNTTACYCQ